MLHTAMPRRNALVSRNFCPLLSAIFLACSLLLLSQFSFADDIPNQPPTEGILILLLSNGDRVSGGVLSANDEQIELGNVYAGRIMIRLSEIKSWQTAEEELRLRLASIINIKDKDTLERESLAAKETAQMVSAKSAATTKDDPKPPKPDPWKRQVNFAYTMTRGNVKSSDANVAFNVARQKGSHKVAFTSYGRRGVSDGKQSASLLSSTFRYEQTFFKLPVFTESQFEIDRLKKLDYRISENLGVSYPLLKGETKQLLFDFGGGVTKEVYETGLQKLNATSLLRLKASQKLTSRTVLNQQATFFSDLADPSAYRVQAEASLTTPITKNLALRLTGINRYDARSLSQVKPNDFTLLTGFTFDF